MQNRRQALYSTPMKKQRTGQSSAKHLAPKMTFEPSVFNSIIAIRINKSTHIQYRETSLTVARDLHNRFCKAI